MEGSGSIQPLSDFNNILTSGHIYIWRTLPVILSFQLHLVGLGIIPSDHINIHINLYITTGVGSVPIKWTLRVN